MTAVPLAVFQIWLVFGNVAWPAGKWWFVKYEQTFNIIKKKQTKKNDNYKQATT